MASPANPTPSTDLIAEMKAGFTEVNAKLAALGSRIDALGYRIDSTRRLLWTLHQRRFRAALHGCHWQLTGQFRLTLAERRRKRLASAGLVRPSARRKPTGPCRDDGLWAWFLVAGWLYRFQ